MTAHPAGDANSGLFGLWFGFLGPPVIWAARIGISYLLVPYACWWDFVLALHLVTALALGAAAFAGFMAWSRWRAAGKGFEVDLDGRLTRARFMAIAGMLSSGIFLLVIAAEGMANVVIHPCQTAGGPM